MNNAAHDLTRAALNAALLADLGDEVTPSKLAAHLCIDSFELYGVLRLMGVMERGTGVRGSTKNSVTEKALREGLMTLEVRDGKRYGKGEYEQPLFTDKGAAAVLHEVLHNPPLSLMRAKRLISIMLLMDTDAAPVPTAKPAAVQKFDVGRYVKVGLYPTKYEIKDFDAAENTYLLGGEFSDRWEPADSLTLV